MFAQGWQCRVEHSREIGVFAFVKIVRTGFFNRLDFSLNGKKGLQEFTTLGAEFNACVHIYFLHFKYHSDINSLWTFFKNKGALLLIYF